MPHPHHHHSSAPPHDSSVCPLLDLHGRTREEAVHAVTNFLERYQHDRGRYLVIITGAGSHSGPTGGPVLRSTVDALLQRRNFIYEQNKPGSFRVVAGSGQVYYRQASNEASTKIVVQEQGEEDFYRDQFHMQSTALRRSQTAAPSYHHRQQRPEHHRHEQYNRPRPYDDGHQQHPHRRMPQYSHQQQHYQDEPNSLLRRSQTTHSAHNLRQPAPSQPRQRHHSLPNNLERRQEINRQHYQQQRDNRNDEDYLVNTLNGPSLTQIAQSEQAYARAREESLEYQRQVARDDRLRQEQQERELELALEVSRVEDSTHSQSQAEEEELLRKAIQHSEAEAFERQQEEEEVMQRALEESKRYEQEESKLQHLHLAEHDEEEVLQQAMRMSLRETSELLQAQQEEDEEFRRVLQLSLND